MQKILYVEDDLSLIDGLKYTLENSGYFVDNARTASEALARFKQDTYDLLLLDAANKIAVSSVLKESNDLDLGSVIDLTCPDGSTVSFSIVGFFDNPEKARLIVGSEQSVILAQEGFTTFISASNSPASEKYIIQLSQHCDMSSTIEKIKSQYSLSDGQIEANMNLLNIEGQLAGKTGVNQIYSIALILSIIVMLTCILMISSTLNSNVTQRTVFFGMLRCLGATKKQIMNFVRLEGLYWCKTC